MRTVKDLINDSFFKKKIEFNTRICMENYASVTGLQKSFFSYNCF